MAVLLLCERLGHGTFGQVLKCQLDRKSSEKLFGAKKLIKVRKTELDAHGVAHTEDAFVEQPNTNARCTTARGGARSAPGSARRFSIDTHTHK